jgi:folate-binding protein YgfZ
MNLQYRALKSGAGYHRLDDRLLVRVSGEDRVSFLHGMCTADVKAMSEGQVAAALFVTERAHVITDIYLYALSDAFLLEIDRGSWPRVRAHLEKFLVADDVEMEELTATALIDIEGPEADTILLSAGCIASRLTPWRFERGVANLPRLRAPAFTVLLGGDTNCSAARDFEQLMVNFSPMNMMPELSSEVLKIIRVERGVARVGVDTNERTLALEARFEPAISLNKGCYIGQETIERATARGGIKRRLFGLQIDGSHRPAIGTPILLDDKPVGVLTSVAESPVFGMIGLSIIHHSAWAEGTRVKLSDPTVTIEAHIAELPFIS